MTELTKRFIENTRKISSDDIRNAFELSALILAFVFCTIALTPIF